MNESFNLNNRDENTTLALWIHTHVRGSSCGFSSVDVHTQYAYRLISPTILGLVVELEENGQCGDYDFFELTSYGNESVRACGTTFNLSSVQHESCAGKDLFKSAMHRITFSDGISTNLKDFRQKTLKLPVKEEFDFESCKGCQKSFKNILLHLSRMDDCRKTYGKEYEKMKQFKCEEKKKHKKEYYHKNIETIRKRKMKLANANKETINAKKRKCDKDHKNLRLEKHRIYNKENRDLINEKQKEYDDANRAKVNEKQRVYDEKNKQEINLKRKAHDSINRKVYMLRAIVLCNFAHCEKRMCVFQALIDFITKFSEIY